VLQPVLARIRRCRALVAVAVAVAMAAPLTAVAAVAPLAGVAVAQAASTAAAAEVVVRVAGVDSRTEEDGVAVEVAEEARVVLVEARSSRFPLSIVFEPAHFCFPRVVFIIQLFESVQKLFVRMHNDRS